MGERITVVERRVDELERSFDRLVRRLPVQIGEATKDPWLGLVLLFFGLGCLLAAGVLGAVAGQAG